MTEIAVPQVNFYSMLSGLGDTLQANRAAQAKKDAFAAATTPGPDGKIDFGRAILGLAQVDPQAAAILAQRQNHEDTLKQQGIESARNASNDAFSHGIQTKQLAISQSNSEKPVFKTVKDVNGNEVLVKMDSDGNNPAPVNVPGQGGQPNNPFSYGKMNENQSKDAGYANRMFQSESVLRDPKLAAASQSTFDRAVDSVLPGDISNRLVSEGYQKYDQAARDFINATLRRESGAAISAPEFDNAYKQYLPRPGDTKEVLAQKTRNRQATISGIAGGGGPAYKPPVSFGQDGEMIPTGNQQQGVTAPKASVPAQAIAALKGNPALKDQFEAKYGRGSAASVLGQ